VPGTPDTQQRLSIVGLVPPQANIGPNPSDTQRQAWINQGHPVTVIKGGEPAISDEFRTKRTNIPTQDSNNVFPNEGVVVGRRNGRFFLEPGESMTVGIDADFAGYTLEEETLVGPDSEALGSAGSLLPNKIQVVSRGPEDARALATGETEFNAVPGTDS
jgi:hypothetical protein